ncbi:hypothetical protein ACLGIH_18435 [Streptomyces sp. HMX87]|uniref:hypothetical protein n=1 Tax=Streptomyces sp. HMX87 TaxID=3390849 RepID=UPI003A86940B
MWSAVAVSYLLLSRTLPRRSPALRATGRITAGGVLAVMVLMVTTAPTRAQLLASAVLAAALALLGHRRARRAAGR